MKTIVILILALIVLPGFSQDSLYNVQFYAYTPKIISISSTFQKFNDAFYEQNDVYDNQVRIDYYSTTQWICFFLFITTTILDLVLLMKPGLNNVIILLA